MEEFKIRSNGSKVENEFAALVKANMTSYADRQRACTRWLIKNYGIRAEHPDDGWVNRKENKVHFCYPPLLLNLKKGDLIALGWPSLDDDKIGEYRIVKVTEIEKTMFQDFLYYHFENEKLNIIVPLEALGVKNG